MLSFKQYKQQKQLTESVEINPIKDLEEVILNAHPEVEKLHLYPSGKHDIKLDTLIVKKEHRKQGVGSKVLHDLKTYADKHGKRIILTANVRDSAWGTTSQSRLDKFYKRNGFVANKGRNKDYAITATHYYAGKGHISESVDHPMIEVDGEMKHRHNSLGQPIHPTDEGIRNFHRWFGDSQMVDEHGRPKVYYHGTSSDIEAFSHDFVGKGNDSHGTGFYFTDSPEVANHFTSGDMTDIKQTAMPNVLPVYLSMKNVINRNEEKPLKRLHIKKIITSAPEHIDSLTNFGDVGYEGYNKVLNKAIDNYGDLSSFRAMQYLHGDFYSNHTKQFLKNFQKTTSYSGVKLDDRGNEIIVAFNPGSIKSATGNIGTFSHPSKINESTEHPMIEVDGEMKHRHNSLGQPIHPTDEGIRNFHRWFGDSQAVDDHGRPIVLYHGTNQDFDTFDFSKARESGHVWASNDPKVASNFAIYRTVWNDANVMPVYVNAKRIKSIDAGYRNIRDVDSVIHDAKRDMDYDAFVVKNARDSVNPYGTDPIADVWAIKDTSNIKSAIGNSGNFSSTSNKITESEDYMGSHTAPTEEDAPAHDLTKVMPEDVYSPDASRYYSTGFSDSEDRNVFAKLHSIRNNPAARLTIYRAIPKSETRDSAITKLERHKAGILKTGRFPAGVDTSKFKNPSEYYDWAYDEVNRLKELPAEENIKKTINKGDWVTLSRAYAKEHGDAHLGGQYRILSKSVRADEVFTNGDSIHEWGYHPKQ